jgi:hypothetical protein
VSNIEPRVPVITDYTNFDSQCYYPGCKNAKIEDNKKRALFASSKCKYTADADITTTQFVVSVRLDPHRDLSGLGRIQQEKPSLVNPSAPMKNQQLKASKA